jgi:hypothetical protein
VIGCGGELGPANSPIRERDERAEHAGYR